jgi:hypothetical protein
VEIMEGWCLSGCDGRCQKEEEEEEDYVLQL